MDQRQDRLEEEYDGSFGITLTGTQLAGAALLKPP